MLKVLADVDQTDAQRIAKFRPQFDALTRRLEKCQTDIDGKRYATGSEDNVLRPALNGSRTVDSDRADSSIVKAWPVLISSAAHGLVGEIAKLATRNSEADPIAVMGTTLAFGAAIFGRNRFMSVGDTQHHSRIFCALVGASSRARKGTSFDPVRRIFRAAEAELHGRSTLPFPSGADLQISPGPLSSGEGLIDAIRDKMVMPDGAHRKCAQ